MLFGLFSASSYYHPGRHALGFHRNFLSSSQHRRLCVLAHEMAHLLKAEKAKEAPPWWWKVPVLAAVIEEAEVLVTEMTTRISVYTSRLEKRLQQKQVLAEYLPGYRRQQPQLRERLGRFFGSVSGWLIIGNIAVFIVVLVLAPSPALQKLVSDLPAVFNNMNLWNAVTMVLEAMQVGIMQNPALQSLAINAGSVFTGFHPWQLLSYLFIHITPIHLFLTSIMLWTVGRPVEEKMGSKLFMVFYLFSGVGAGVFGLLGALLTGAPTLVLGASGAIFGLLTAYVIFFSERTVEFLLFYIVPIRIKAKYLAWLFAGIEVFFMATGIMGNISHWAHLGGLLFGYLFFVWGLLELSAWFYKRKGDTLGKKPASRQQAQTSWLKGPFHGRGFKAGKRTPADQEHAPRQPQQQQVFIPGVPARPDSGIDLIKTEKQLRVLAADPDSGLTKEQIPDILARIAGGVLMVRGEDIDVIKVNENGEEAVLGPLDINLVHQLGLLHRTADVFIITPEGTLLVMERAHFMEEQPLHLTIAGGHGLGSMTYQQIAEHEVTEEAFLPGHRELQGKMEMIGQAGDFSWLPNLAANRERNSVFIYRATAAETRRIREKARFLEKKKRSLSQLEYKNWLSQERQKKSGLGEVYGIYEFSLYQLAAIASGRREMLAERFAGREKAVKRIQLTEDVLKPLLQNEQVLRLINQAAAESMGGWMRVLARWRLRLQAGRFAKQEKPSRPAGRIKPWQEKGIRDVKRPGPQPSQTKPDKEQRFDLVPNLLAFMGWGIILLSGLLPALAGNAHWFAYLWSGLFGTGTLLFGVRSFSALAGLVLAKGARALLGDEYFRDNRKVQWRISARFDRPVDFSSLGGIDRRLAKTERDKVYIASWLVRDIHWRAASQPGKRTLLAALQALNIFLRSLLLPHVLAQEQLRVRGKTDPAIYLNPILPLAYYLSELANPIRYFLFLRKMARTRVFADFNQQSANRPLLPGMEKLTAALRQTGLPAFIATSNHEEHVRQDLARRQLPPFSGVFGAKYSKQDIIRRAHAADENPGVVVMFGDGAEDMETARGIPNTVAVGCTQDAKKSPLDMRGAQHLIHDYRDFSWDAGTRTLRFRDAKTRKWIVVENVKAVVFDFDGTVIDNHALLQETNVRLLAALLGLQPDDPGVGFCRALGEDFFAEVNGMPFSEAAAFLYYIFSQFDYRTRKSPDLPLAARFQFSWPDRLPLAEVKALDCEDITAEIQQGRSLLAAGQKAVIDVGLRRLEVDLLQEMADDEFLVRLDDKRQTVYQLLSRTFIMEHLHTAYHVHSPQEYLLGGPVNRRYCQVLGEVMTAGSKVKALGKAVYLGAFADVSSALMATRAGTMLFVDLAPFLPVAPPLPRAEQQRYIQKYLASKMAEGYAAALKPEVMDAMGIWPFLRAELAVLGATHISEPVQHADDARVYTLTFNWEGQTRTLIYVSQTNANEVDAYAGQLERLGQADCLIIKGGQYLHLGKDPSRPLGLKQAAKASGAIAMRHLAEGGYVLVDHARALPEEDIRRGQLQDIHPGNARLGALEKQGARFGYQDISGEQHKGAYLLRKIKKADDGTTTADMPKRLQQEKSLQPERGTRFNFPLLRLPVRFFQLWQVPRAILIFVLFSGFMLLQALRLLLRAGRKTAAADPAEQQEALRILKRRYFPRDDLEAREFNPDIINTEALGGRVRLSEVMYGRFISPAQEDWIQDQLILDLYRPLLEALPAPHDASFILRLRHLLARLLAANILRYRSAQFYRQTLAARIREMLGEGFWRLSRLQPLFGQRLLSRWSLHLQPEAHKARIEKHIENLAPETARASGLRQELADAGTSLGRTYKTMTGRFTAKNCTAFLREVQAYLARARSTEQQGIEMRYWSEFLKASNLLPWEIAAFPESGSPRGDGDRTQHLALPAEWLRVDRDLRWLRRCLDPLFYVLREDLLEKIRFQRRQRTPRVAA
ncbi:rhomboid family intramembrane serine protease [candidate division FCPU426 bacterium]|nr:rhomboid family intramembrane serine protease [candidate division FCPU426 bacterium]